MRFHHCKTRRVVTSRVGHFQVLSASFSAQHSALDWTIISLYGTTSQYTLNPH